MCHIARSLCVLSSGQRLSVTVRFSWERHESNEAKGGWGRGAIFCPHRGDQRANLPPPAASLDTHGWARSVEQGGWTSISHHHCSKEQRSTQASSPPRKEVSCVVFTQGRQPEWVSRLTVLSAMVRVGPGSPTDSRRELVDSLSLTLVSSCVKQGR